jgi:hypothetical protein
MTLIVVLLNFEGRFGSTVSCSCPGFGLLQLATHWAGQCLKSAAYAEPENALFLTKDKWKTVNELVFPRVGIISINKAKRHVENWNLKANLGAHTAPYIRELGEQTFIKADYGICLRVATHKYWKEPDRQTLALDRPVRKGLIKFGLGHDAVIARYQRTEERAVRKV